MFKNQLFIVVVFLSFLGCKTRTDEPQQAEIVEKKPNVLIIFPDQLRRYSAGFWSEAPYKNVAQGKADPVVTPTIDMLAKNGVVFSNAISNFPLCSPYRGMLLSGRYPEQNGIWNNCRKDRDESLRNDIETIPSLFYKAGYNTSYFGKCHWLKNEPLFDSIGNYVGKTEAPGGHYVNLYDTYIPPGKPRHDIEYFYQSLKDEHYNPRVYSNDPSVINGKKDGELYLPKTFSAKNEAEVIIQYLKNEQGQRDSKKPFCAIWSLNPPHNPWDDENTDMEALREYYDEDKFEAIDEKLVVRNNVVLDTAHYARHYYANVTSADKYIGQVISELEKMGELDNTIILFSSDHGEMLGSHGKTGKNMVELESLAIPFIVHWPSKIQSGLTDILFSVPDVLPTVMGLAGLANDIPAEIQGINFASLLLKEQGAVEKPEAALILLENARGVLTERYTLCITIPYGDDGQVKKGILKEAFIYDNVNDPYQLNKINFEDRPEVSKQLLANLGQLLKNTNDPWFQNRYFDTLITY